MRVCDTTREMRMITMLPFAPHPAFWITHNAGTEYGDFVVSTGGARAMGTESNLRLNWKIKPDVLISMTAFLHSVLNGAVRDRIKRDQQFANPIFSRVYSKFLSL